MFSSLRRHVCFGCSRSRCPARHCMLQMRLIIPFPKVSIIRLRAALACLTALRRRTGLPLTNQRLIT